MNNMTEVEIKQQEEYISKLKGEKRRIEGYLQYCRRPAQSAELSRQLRNKNTEIERATNTLNKLYLERGGIEQDIDPREIKSV